MDCGSGIGRISKHLLTKHFKRVDLVEQNSEFLETAKTYLAERAKKIGQFFPVGTIKKKHQIDAAVKLLIFKFIVNRITKLFP